MKMKRDNAVKKLIRKYEWAHCEGWSWANGLIFEKEFHNNEFLRVITTLDGIKIDKMGYYPEDPRITYEEIKLFKAISDSYKEDYEWEKRFNAETGEIIK